MRRFIGAAFIVSYFLTSVSASATEQESASPSKDKQSISKLCKIEFFRGKPYFPNLLGKSLGEKCFFDNLSSEPCSGAVDVRSVPEQHALFTTILSFTSDQAYYTTPFKGMLHNLALSAASHAHAKATEISLKVEIARSTGDVLTHATLRGIFVRSLLRRDADVKLFSDAERAAFDALTLVSKGSEASRRVDGNDRNSFAAAVKNASKNWLKAYHAAMKSLVAAKVAEAKDETSRLLKIALLKPDDTVETLQNALLVPYYGLPILAQQLSRVDVGATDEWEVVDDADHRLVNKASAQPAPSWDDSAGSVAEQEKSLGVAAEQEQGAGLVEEQANTASAVQHDIGHDSDDGSEFEENEEPVFWSLWSAAGRFLKTLTDES